ncbi:MAG: hypothetical protein FJY37_01435 [Betaproteobacteria bacterium]|nr:hypothetical protein [Betaproteobacteria bacterium]
MKLLLALLILPLLCWLPPPQAEAQSTRTESASKAKGKASAARKASAKQTAKSVAKQRDTKVVAKSKRTAVEARKSSARGNALAKSKRNTVKSASSRGAPTAARRSNGNAESLRGAKPLEPLAARPATASPTTPSSAPSTLAAASPVATLPAAPATPATSTTAPATLSSGTLAAWIGIPILSSLAAVLLQRRRRVPEDDSPLAEPIDPVLHLEPTEVALSSAQLREDLLQRAEPFYIDLRAASGRKDHDYILRHCTEDMAISLILDSEIAKTKPKVEALKAELVGLFEEVNRYVASVQYTADEHHGDPIPRKVKEVWHLIRDPATPDWRLAAVEPG